MRYGYPNSYGATSGRFMIRKSSLVQWGDNFNYGVFAVAVSVTVFAYSTLVGPVAILVFYALWMPLVFVDYRAVIGNFTRFWWIFPFAAFACLSYLWSAAPDISLRSSIQYMTTVICALIASRTIDLRTFLAGMNVGIFAVLLYSLHMGTYHYDPLDGTYTLVGGFASKNQIGFYASLGVYFAFAILTSGPTRARWRWFAVLAAGVALYCLILSASATSIITTAAILCFGVAALFIGRLTPHMRLGILIVLAFVMLFAIMILLAVGLAPLLEAFGKDATLTGRTYLWQVGIEAVEKYPLSGRGYYAYWVQGFSDAEQLWKEFYIETRGGFHFHNTYIETAVELGYIGLVFLVLMFCILFAVCLHGLLLRNDPATRVLFAIVILLFIRSFFEIDVVQPYVIGSFLLYYIAGQVAMPQRRPRPRLERVRPIRFPPMG